MNIVDGISDPIDIDIDVEVAIAIDGKIMINMELKSFLNESVLELIHFLAKIKKVPTEEFDDLVSFSFNDEDKDRLIEPHATWR